MDFETLVNTRRSVRGFRKQHPDDSFPANGVRSDRSPNGDFVRYVGFND